MHYYSIAYAAIYSVFPLAVTEGDPAFSLCKTLDHDARSKGELHGTDARRGDGPAISFHDRNRLQGNGKADATRKQAFFQLPSQY